MEKIIIKIMISTLNYYFKLLDNQVLTVEIKRIFNF